MYGQQVECVLSTTISASNSLTCIGLSIVDINTLPFRINNSSGFLRAMQTYFPESTSCKLTLLRKEIPIKEITEIKLYYTSQQIRIII